VFTKKPLPDVAVKSAVLTVVFQDTSPVEPKPAAVPKLEIVAPDGIVTVSPEAPSVKVVPHCGSLYLLLF